MILASNAVAAQTTGTGEAVAFEIANDPIAFDILSNRLYNDKIGAVVREICCNARDAQVEAGRGDIPFELTLPTAFEPKFCVKDSGIGMSDEQIKKLYCSYFRSTKRESNASIGCLGLGSKSPFCYVKGYNVVSIYQGERRVYSVRIGDKGFPVVELMGEPVPTEEHDGLEVSLSVPPRDFQEFQNKARIALEFITPTPTVNVEGFEPVKTEYVLRTEKWGIRAKAWTHQTRSVRAIMGGVAYSTGNIDTSRLTATQRRILEMPVDLFFPLGSLDFAASRETLSNTEQTVEAILKAIGDVYLTLVDEIKAAIDLLPTLWDATLELARMSSSPMGAIVKAAQSEGSLDGTYTNFTLDTKRKFVTNQLDFHAINLFQFSRRPKSAHWAEKIQSFMRKDTGRWAEVQLALARGTQSHAGFDFEIHPNTKTLFVMNDLKLGGDKYVHYLLQDLKGVLREDCVIERVYMITKQHKCVAPEVFFEEVQKMTQEDLGGAPLIRLSELQQRFADVLDVPKTKRLALPRERREVWMLNTEGRHSNFFNKTVYSWWQEWVKPDASAFADVNYYFIIKDNQPVIPNISFQSCQAFCRYVRDLCVAFRIDNVFGLRAHSKLIGQPGWINLAEYIPAQLEKLLANPRKLTELSLLLGAQRVADGDLVTHIWNKRLLTPDSAARIFGSMYVAAYEGQDKPENEALHSVMQVLGVRVAREKLPNFTELYLEMVDANYPMLKHSRIDLKDARVMHDVLGYMKMMDNQRRETLAFVTAAQMTAQETGNANQN